MNFHRTYLFALSLGLLMLVGATGCDSSDPDPTSDEVTINGRVTSDAGYDSEDEARAAGPVEGATVTAVAVDASGQTSPLQGSATTDADGEFSLETDGTSNVVVVMAEAEGFRSSALVEAGAATDGAVTAPPMTAESHAEAEVYVEARSRSQQVHVADAVAHVTARTAAEIESDAATTADVAAALAAAVEAEAHYLRHDDGGDASAEEVEESREYRRTRFATFRASVASATSAAARAAAVRAFEEAYANAYAESGLTMSHQAEASQAGARAAVQFSGSSEFATTQQARLYAALATALAAEQAFEANGAASTRLDALAEARADLVAAIRAATSASAVAAAQVEYVTNVRTELAAEADLSATVIESAFAAMSAAETTLDASVEAASSAEAVAEAYVAYFGDAREVVEELLGADAALAVQVIVLLSLL